MLDRDIYTVTRLNTEVRTLLETHFLSLWIEGEISNFASPRSGHWYFSLKDEQAQVRCAMFRQHNRLLNFTPGNGAHVFAHARVGLYRERGDFQLIVEFLELAGEGALRRAFEALKHRLATEGLFAEEKKRQLPAFPRSVGVITSPTGAALRDVLHVLERRFPAIEVMVYPTSVQGESAVLEVIHALEAAEDRRECDVLLLVRGGGSFEDLWVFNQEPIARTMAGLTLPIVTGIGHETDLTIADLVADRRAPTPSAAAELVSPDQFEQQERLDILDTRLLTQMHLRLQSQQRQLTLTAKRLVHPLVKLQRMREHTNQLIKHFKRARQIHFGVLTQRLERASLRLEKLRPGQDMETKRLLCIQLRQRLAHALSTHLSRHRARVEELHRALQTLSPQRTLDRGYAVVTHHSNNLVVRRGNELAKGEQIKVQLAEGSLECTVDESRKATPKLSAPLPLDTKPSKLL